MDVVPALARWLHLLAGVMWIGLLYYFNFVQVAALKAAQADSTAPGITKHVAPRALLYFRWAAVVTWLAGAALLGGNFLAAFTFQGVYAAIGMGAWLGTIMLFNVWVLIWPNQKKILGIVPATDEQKAKARVSRSWPRASTPCCPSRCCSSWARAGTRLFISTRPFTGFQPVASGAPHGAPFQSRHAAYPASGQQCGGQLAVRRSRSSLSPKLTSATNQRLPGR
jgi:uncharacterized membrane protein